MLTAFVLAPRFADDVVQPRILDVEDQIHAVDPPSGGGGPLKQVFRGETYMPR